MEGKGKGDEMSFQRIRCRLVRDFSRITVEGADPSGCMFGTGYLLRKMRFSPGRIEAPSGGVISLPLLTRKMFSPEPSET